MSRSSGEGGGSRSSRTGRESEADARGERTLLLWAALEPRQIAAIESAIGELEELRARPAPSRLERFFDALARPRTVVWVLFAQVGWLGGNAGLWLLRLPAPDPLPCPGLQRLSMALSVAFLLLGSVVQRIRRRRLRRLTAPAVRTIEEACSEDIAPPELHEPMESLLPRPPLDGGPCA